MNIIIAIGAAHALYLSILIITKKSKILPDYFLCANISLYFLMFALAYFALDAHQTDWLVVLINANLLLAPIFFIYASSLMDPRYQFRLSYLVHLLPYFLSTLYLCYIFVVLSGPELDTLFKDLPILERPYLFNLVLLCDFLAIPAYVWWILKLLKRHRQTLADHFSNFDAIDFHWLKRLTLVTGLGWLVCDLPYQLNDGSNYFSEESMLTFVFVMATPFVFYLGYFGFKQTAVFSGTSMLLEHDGRTDSSPATRKYKKSGLDKEQAERYLKELQRFMTDEKPYLHSLLSIHDLAKSLGISSHNLSQIINEQLGQSFYDFINQYRVEEFKRSLVKSEHRHHTLLAVALDCGFNSKASFNRVFKQFIHLTPSAYQKQLTS